jgi:hypothetical protein
MDSLYDLFRAGAIGGADGRVPARFAADLEMSRNCHENHVAFVTSFN